MPLRNDGIICQECGGSGCPACSQSGYSYTRTSEQQVGTCFADIPIVPMPYGKLLPDLTDCYDANSDDTPEWLMIYCPNCNSDHVVGLPDYHDADWFCITCHDSWCYEREH